MSESWARTSIRVSAEGLSVGDIADVLGIAAEDPTARHWLHSVESSGEEPLADQLDRLAIFLPRLADGLRRLGEYELIVLIGWTPREGQDGVAFSPALLADLAELKALLLIDTYTEDWSSGGNQRGEDDASVSERAQG
jgi:hypothetical protein